MPSRKKPTTFQVLAIAIAIAAAITQTACSQSVRVTVDGVCGSGTICGTDETNAYILTNAHVAGTQLGRVVNVDYDRNGQRERHQATIAIAAYSSRTLTDWCLLKCPALKNENAWKLSINPPSLLTPHFTCGSPRCVWPLVCSQVRSTSIDNRTGLWKWTPNSIGGQSGSGVREQNNLVKGLLTWSWGGQGAGQTTAQIATQLRNRDTSADERPAGLIEVAEKRSPCNEGFFAEAEATFPIWAEDDTGPVIEPGTIEAKEQELRSVATARYINLPKLLDLIIQIIKLIQPLTTE
jgi:hypothetical protein